MFEWSIIRGSHLICNAQPIRQIVMKYLVALLALFHISGCASNGPSPVIGPGTYAVAELLGDLDETLAEVFVAARDNGLRLAEVKLDLNTVIANKEDGKLKILFLSLGGSTARATTSQYTVTLGIPEKLDETTSAVSATSSLKEFATALGELVRNSEQYTVGDLKTESIKAQLKFYVKETKGVEAGQEFEVVPLTLSAGEAVTAELTQTITLTIRQIGGG